MRYIIWILISFLPFNLSSQNPLEIDKDSLIKVQLSTALIGKSVEVTAKIINGNIILEGDIFLGKLDDFLVDNAAGRAAAIINKSATWPNGIVPYTIQNNHEDEEDVIAAINYMNALEAINITMIDNSILNSDNYIEFVDTRDGCNSRIGMIGGRQEINTVSVCSFGTTVHEIIHALGFLHEQSRNDRDTYVTINEDNIEDGRSNNFDKYDFGQDIGPYDYNSIMHYRANAFSKSTDINTISINIPPGTSSTTIGQRDSLSEGDIKGINRLYPYCDCSNVPTNLEDLAAIESTFACFQASNLLSSSASIPIGSVIALKAGNRIELSNLSIEGKLIAEVSDDFCEGSVNDLKAGDIALSKIHSNTTDEAILNPLSSLKVTPNPFSQQAIVTYTLPIQAEVSIQLLDLLGRQIRIIKEQTLEEAGVHSSLINSENLTKGTYILLFRSGNLMETKKIMVL